MDIRRTDDKRGLAVKAARTPASPVPKESKIITANILTAEEIVDAKSIFFVSKEAIIIERRRTLTGLVMIKTNITLIRIGLKLLKKMSLLTKNNTWPDPTRPIETIRKERILYRLFESSNLRSSSPSNLLFTH